MNLDGYRYISTPIDSEIIKINSTIKQEGINYALGIRIIIKEYLKRTVSEKYHVEINSFKIKIELCDNDIVDIQLLGKDTYWEYKNSLKEQLLGFDDILYQIDNIIKEEEVKNKSKIIDTYNKLLKLKEDKCNLINKRFCYNEQESDIVIAKLGTLEDVIETLKDIDIVIPEKIIGGITKQIS